MFPLIYTITTETRPLRAAELTAGAVMILRNIFISLIIFDLAARIWAHVEIEAEDYFFPLEPVINFCKMSDQCQHDFVPICGQDSLGITRMFNDNCDLYEYNCDEKKQYRHVKLDVCKYEAAAAEIPER